MAETVAENVPRTRGDEPLTKPKLVLCHRHRAKRNRLTDKKLFNSSKTSLTNKTNQVFSFDVDFDLDSYFTVTPKPKFTIHHPH